MSAIGNLAEGWQKMKITTVNLVWSKIYPECTVDFLGFQQPKQKVPQEIVELAPQAGFNEIN